jgi:hypothetical protein
MTAVEPTALQTRRYPVRLKFAYCCVWQVFAGETGVAKFVDSLFSKAVIPLDGAEYQGCTFAHCLLVFCGGELPKLSNCTFQNCSWTFKGAAQRMQADERRVFIENILRPAAMSQPHQIDP